MITLAFCSICGPRLVHSGSGCRSPSLGSDLTFATRTGSRQGIEMHLFRVETHRDLSTWTRILVQGCHAAAELIKEVSLGRDTFVCFTLSSFLFLPPFLSYLLPPLLPVAPLQIPLFTNPAPSSTENGNPPWVPPYPRTSSLLSGLSTFYLAEVQAVQVGEGEPMEGDRIRDSSAPVVREST